MDVDHRHRRLGRDATDLSPDIMIQNQIANHQDSGLGEPLNVLVKRAKPRVRHEPGLPSPHTSS